MISSASSARRRFSVRPRILPRSKDAANSVLRSPNADWWSASRECRARTNGTTSTIAIASMPAARLARSVMAEEYSGGEPVRRVDTIRTPAYLAAPPENTPKLRNANRFSAPRRCPGGGVPDAAIRPDPRPPLACRCGSYAARMDHPPAVVRQDRLSGRAGWTGDRAGGAGQGGRESRDLGAVRAAHAGDVGAVDRHRARRPSRAEWIRAHAARRRGHGWQSDRLPHPTERARRRFPDGSSPSLASQPAPGGDSPHSQ